MGVQADVWHKFGVSLAYGDAVMSDRMAEIMRAFHPRNNEQAVAAARLLGMPFMCCHTPADNNVNKFLQAAATNSVNDGTVDELLDMLKEIPEYRQAVLEGTGPTIFEGGAKRRTGKIMVDMTGGTSGPVDPSASWPQPASAPSSACTWAKSTARRPKKSTSTWSSPATCPPTPWG